MIAIKRLLLLILLTAAPAFGTVTQLVGTLTDTTGTPVTGTACLRLPVNAVDTSTNRALSPQTVCFALTNGAFPAFASVVPNDKISPANTYYQFKVTNQSGGLVFMANYVIPTGAGTFNIGLAIPTSVTTTSISFASPVQVNVANVFTQPQTFPQINSSNGPISTTGFLRLGTADTIKIKNFNNTLDLNLLSLDSFNRLFVGDANVSGVYVGGAGVAGSLQLFPTTITGASIGDFIISPGGVASGFNLLLNGFDGQTNPASGSNINLKAGNGGLTTGAGGFINITAGNGGTTGTGGDVVIAPGGGGTAKGKTTLTSGFLFYPPQFLFANLATPANGALVYCSDCTIANPCAGAGTGAMAKRLNGVWVCN